VPRYLWRPRCVCAARRSPLRPHPVTQARKFDEGNYKHVAITKVEVDPRCRGGHFLLASKVTYNMYAGPQSGGNWGDDGQHIRHVLLISIDGMHVVDFTPRPNGGVFK
jgi:hypothetical protein